MTYITTPL